MWIIAAILLVAAAEDAAGTGTSLDMLAGQLLGWLPISLLTIRYLDKKHSKPGRRPLSAPDLAKAYVGYVILGVIAGILLLFAIGGFVADHVLPRIPAVERSMDTLPGCGH